MRYWGRVERNRAECPPVRQIQFPLHRKPSELRTRIKGKSVDWRRTSERTDVARNPVATFYVWNIPMMGNDSFLKNILAERGDLVDFYIPAKASKTGGNFGFARFQNFSSMEEMSARLDDIWIGSYKIRVKPARFAREHNPGARSVPYQRRSDRSFPIARPGWRRENLSYAGSLKGYQCSQANVSETHNLNSPINDQSPCISFHPSEEECSWLHGSLIGSLKDKYSWVINGSSILQEISKSCLISFLGSDLILIRSLPGVSVKLDDPYFAAWSRKWLDYVGDWNEDIIHKKMTIWTILFGVPLKAWSPRFFKMVTAKFGSLIHIDESTSSKQNLSKLQNVVAITPVLKLHSQDRWSSFPHQNN